MRQGISRDLGFTASERSENLRRSAEVAKLFNESGLICIAAFVAPSETIRAKARDLIGPDRFIVVHLDAPVEVCRQRDQEGLYGAAETGEIAEFPGISFEYEKPSQPDLVLRTAEWPPERCVDEIIKLLEERDIV
jgi:bifunctional enzyme CysN/CysC